MKVDWSSGSSFLSEWLLINGADGGNISLLAEDCQSARQFSDHSRRHAACHMLLLFQPFFFLQSEQL